MSISLASFTPYKSLAPLSQYYRYLDDNQILSATPSETPSLTSSVKSSQIAANQPGNMRASITSSSGNGNVVSECKLKKQSKKRTPTDFDWLPQGWTVECVPRKTLSKTVADYYYIFPGYKRFRSKKEVLEFEKFRRMRFNESTTNDLKSFDQDESNSGMKRFRGATLDMDFLNASAVSKRAKVSYEGPIVPPITDCNVPDTSIVECAETLVALSRDTYF